MISLIFIPTSSFSSVQSAGILGQTPCIDGCSCRGSLTTDQWFLMATIVGPIAVHTFISLHPLCEGYIKITNRSHKFGMITCLIQMWHARNGRQPLIHIFRKRRWMLKQQRRHKQQRSAKLTKHTLVPAQRLNQYQIYLTSQRPAPQTHLTLIDRGRNGSEQRMPEETKSQTRMIQNNPHVFTLTTLQIS